MNYLENNLLPLVLTIKPKKTSSHILEALGMEDKVSPQSILITFGERIERFWNKVISDSSAINLIEDNDRITVGDRERQIDHLFSVDSKTYYLESKCNLTFDSEKVRASNDKISDIVEVLGKNVESAYFVPVVSKVSDKEVNKYAKKGVSVVGVSWLLDKIDAPFSEAEYFEFLKEVVSPILEEKGL